MGVLTASEGDQGRAGKIGTIERGIPEDEAGKLTPGEAEKIKRVIGKIGAAKEENIRCAKNAIERPI